MAKLYAVKFYHSKLWKDARQYALRRDHFTCQMCFDRAEEIHHIIELTQENINDVNISLNVDNLQSLCRRCHANITKGYVGAVDSEYIFSDDGQVIERDKQ